MPLPANERLSDPTLVAGLLSVCQDLQVNHQIPFATRHQSRPSSVVCVSHSSFFSGCYQININWPWQRSLRSRRCPGVCAFQPWSFRREVRCSRLWTLVARVPGSWCHLSALHLRSEGHTWETGGLLPAWEAVRVLGPANLPIKEVVRVSSWHLQ